MIIGTGIPIHIPIEKIIRTSKQSASTSWQFNTSENRHQSATYDSVFWEKGTNVLGNLGEKKGSSWLQPNGMGNRTHGKLYIFGKIMLSSFQKCRAFYAYHKPIHLAVIRSSSVFPVCLVPFSQIRNHMGTCAWSGRRSIGGSVDFQGLSGTCCSQYKTSIANCIWEKLYSWDRCSPHSSWRTSNLSLQSQVSDFLCNMNLKVGSTWLLQESE